MLEAGGTCRARGQRCTRVRNSCPDDGSKEREGDEEGAEEEEEGEGNMLICILDPFVAKQGGNQPS